MRIRKLTLLLFLLVSLLGYGQNVLEKSGKEPANAVDAEKIYLQFSGNTYDTNETVWFKALVVNARSHLPTTRSVVLHVELIDPQDGYIVESKLLKINNGVADGFFQLHSNFREGKYVIRAYTEWNRNFGNDFIVSKEISVYSFRRAEDRPNPIRDVVFTKDLDKNKFTVNAKVFPRELDSLYKGESTIYVEWKDHTDSIRIKPRNNKNSDITHEVSAEVQLVNYRLKTGDRSYTKSVVLDREYGSLQFFPEGGSLVNGIESVVGIKYLDYKGKGQNIRGSIVDGDDVTIAQFQCNMLGMGKTILLPETSKAYFGKIITENGNTFRYELPRARATGTVLRVRHSKVYRDVVLRSNSGRADSAFIRIYHRGKDLYLLKAKLKNGSLLYKLKNKDLPHGIVGVTAYDKDFKPVCERLFFNNRPEENLTLTLATNKSDYGVRDSVTLSVQTKKGAVALPASLSVMVTDLDYFKDTNLDRSNILSYFHLQSDIRGKIENPFYYFQGKGNFDDLEALMLTQGWRNYKYDTLKKPKYIQAEKRLSVSGTVGGIQNMKKRKKFRNNTYGISMLLMGNPTEAYTQEIDSTGRFRFVLGESYGQGRKYGIQPTDAQNRSKSFKVNIKNRKIPEIAYEKEKLIVPVDSTIEKRIAKKIAEDIRRDPFLLPNTIELDEVEVSDYELTPERAEMAELHGMPDVVVDNTELLKKERNWTGALYPWLLFNYPQELSIDRVGDGGGFQIASVHGAGFTYVVVDGIPVQIDFYDLIENIPLRAVKSVEINRNAITANRYCLEVFNSPCLSLPEFPAILAIYTYSGTGLFGAFPKRTNLMRDTAPQYSPKREFYAPEYPEPEAVDWNVPDVRTLLHWEPSLITDLNGKGNLTFYNSDTTGKKLIICEAIDGYGNIGYSELIYEVKE